VALLELEGVGVAFGGLRALDDVSLAIGPGAVTALIGPNGAGKTTLFDVVSGFLRPGSGRVVFDGRDVTALRPHARARLGLARTFQRIELFRSLSVRENVLVAAEASRSANRSPGLAADAALARVGLRDVASQRVDTLSPGRARMVELARTLVAHPRMLLLDEPSAGLDGAEAATLTEVLRDLAATGIAVLLVEHDMSVVMAASHRVVVLGAGRVVVDGTAAAVRASPAARALYLGPSGRRRPSPTSRSPDGGRPVLELRDVTAGYGPTDVLRGVSLAVPAGLVVAVLGPNGAGKSTLVRVAGGHVVPRRGSMYLLGRRIGAVAPDALARAGVCTIPDSRGVFPNLTVAENLRVDSRHRRTADLAERVYAQFPVLAARHRTLAGRLSGGEQRMLAIARALATDPVVLIMDELSQGLAPRVVATVYEKVRALADEGVPVIAAEQFADQVLRVADVVAVMERGRVRLGDPDGLVGQPSRTDLGGWRKGEAGG